ncbi:hypothetical protein RR46_04286 [Papilio xuthus]|uniref:Uncharacterized protein n=1 Tax=Papilio xuthus TaxID=66420 RepID=A0A194QE24_PAPXU|nr:hypothetical protein RR46_04286 [Papilio xuthus]
MSSVYEQVPRHSTYLSLPPAHYTYHCLATTRSGTNTEPPPLEHGTLSDDTPATGRGGVDDVTDAGRRPVTFRVTARRSATNYTIRTIYSESNTAGLNTKYDFSKKLKYNKNMNTENTSFGITSEFKADPAVLARPTWWS